MLREPLTIAKGWMHTLRHSELSPEQERVAVVVDQQINELTCLLTDLLDSVRREATILELRLEVVDVAALVEQAAACQREQTDLQHVELEVHQDAAEAYAYVDCERITQALHMLINSACQRAPQCGDGKIDLTVALDKTAVHVTIRDNGIGIAAQHLPHIFEPFYQLEDHSRSNTSLELNTAYELVRSHGGALSVESAPGCGTAFHIWLHRVKRPPRNPA
jgi:signal transduction histidine kinase